MDLLFSPVPYFFIESQNDSHFSFALALDKLRFENKITEKEGDNG